MSVLRLPTTCRFAVLQVSSHRGESKNTHVHPVHEQTLPRLRTWLGFSIVDANLALPCASLGCQHDATAWTNSSRIQTIRSQAQINWSSLILKHKANQRYLHSHCMEHPPCGATRGTVKPVEVRLDIWHHAMHCRSAHAEPIPDFYLMLHRVPCYKAPCVERTIVLLLASSIAISKLQVNR